MASGTSNIVNVSSRIKNPSAHEGGHICVNMAKSHINVATRSHDYGSSHTVVGPEPPPSAKAPLQISKSKPLPHIPKGLLKCFAYNPNAKSTQNYLVVKDLVQTSCVISTLEVL
jgi:hypothetical protein